MGFVWGIGYPDVEPSRPQPSDPSRPTRPVFVAHDGFGTRLWAAPEYDAGLRALHLDSQAGFDRLIGPLVPDRTRSAGRAHTTTVQTTDGLLHVKQALKGGVLAPLFFSRIPIWRRISNELHIGAELHARGAPVPRAVFAAGRLGPLGWRAVLGSALVPDALDGASALAREADLDPRATCRALGRAIRTLHDRGGWHADLAITNLLFVPKEDRAWIVDLQGGRVGSPPPVRRRQRELARLKRSIERRPAIAHVLTHAWSDLVAAYEEADGSV